MAINDGGPAFPHVSSWMQEFGDEGKCIGCWPSGGGGGMSLRQYAAIKLRVPDSGTDWLDAMIRHANLDEFAVGAPPMDVADICNVMGWPTDLRVGAGEDGEAWSEDSVWSRWRDEPLANRLRADAKFRYSYAKLMLAARDTAREVPNE